LKICARLNLAHYQSKRRKTMSEHLEHEPEKDNPYEVVPNKGERFEENGKTYYWTFADTEVGTVSDEVERAFRQDMGGYFGVRTHVKAVEEQTTPNGRIVKWEILEGHGEKMKGDPNPNYGKPDGDSSMPDYDTYRKMHS